MNTIALLDLSVNDADLAVILAVPEPTTDEWLTPYWLGALDAMEGKAFCPEAYFVRVGQTLEYTEGFESVRGESEITRAFKAQWPAREEAIEDDHEFIRIGC